MSFANCYQDLARAEAYSKLQFANTYYLAYRDLPELIGKYARGPRALDFGCGTGRSSRFLRELGFQVVGVDISGDMLRKAREIDPGGDYRLVPNGDLTSVEPAFDLVLSAFTFDNIAEQKPALFRQLTALLQPEGILVNLVSAPEIYVHEWASFSTRDFLEQNRRAEDGDTVRIIVTDHGDRRPVEDIRFSDAAYRGLYARVGLEVREMRQPLARGDEPYRWVSETSVAPWTVYVLKRAAR